MLWLASWNSPARETLPERALTSSHGVSSLSAVEGRREAMVQRRRYDEERAQSLFLAAIDEAVWAYLETAPLRRIMYRNHLVSPERARAAQRLAHAFGERHEVGAQA